jgi:DNA modification methylase
MKKIKPKSVNMVFCDLPYGVTQRNKWDSVIPPELLWEQYERIITDNGAILLFGQDKFTAMMMLFKSDIHRYNIIWKKTTPTGFLNAKKMPMRTHEDIMVFYKNLPTYNPQKTTGHKRKVSTAEHKRNSTVTTDYGEHGLHTYDSTERYPTSVWEFPTDKQKCPLHPTQKPIELCRYTIRTYTNEGDLVLDNCCGSGSIPLAAKLENRNYIGMDNGICEKKNSKYDGWFWADVARDRIENYIT